MWNLLIFENIFISPLYSGVWRAIYVGLHKPQFNCGGQRRICGNCFSLFTMWIQGINLCSSCLVSMVQKLILWWWFCFNLCISNCLAPFIENIFPHWVILNVEPKILISVGHGSTMPVILLLRRLRQEDHKFEVGLDCVARCYWERGRETERNRDREDWSYTRVFSTLYYWPS